MQKRLLPNTKTRCINIFSLVNVYLILFIMSSSSNLIKYNSNSFRIMKGEPYHK